MSRRWWRVVKGGAKKLRLTELLLFLAPFVAFAAWWLTASAGGPSRAVLIGAACAIAVLAGILVWTHQKNALVPGAAYVPASLQDGRVVPGHAASQAASQ